jgi:CheY-like chemotaxis protein
MHPQRPTSSPTTKARFLNEVGRPNSVGLHQRELSELLDQMDIPDGPRKSIKRDFVRWPFRKTAVPMKITHPNGISATLSVACRNISRGGMAILHSAFLHPGTRCSITLPHPTRGELHIEGWIARCIHRNGMIHEIGITFAEPVDVRELLRPDPLANVFSFEKIDPEKLHGNILCVDASETDQKIVRHFLRSSKLEVQCVLTPTEALEHLPDGWDLVILDLNLPEGGGAGLVISLRERGYKGPIIVTTSDTSPQVRKVLSGIEANAFLAKPLAQSTLTRAMAEFLIAQRTTSIQGGSALPADHPDFALAESFAMSLRHTARKLEDAVRRDDAGSCRALCLQLAGTAPSLGFEALGSMAQQASEELAKTNSVSNAIKTVRALIAACERAKARKVA